MSGLFERASRSKLRFAYNGNISVEDLWDISLTQLDKLYGILRLEQKSFETESLLQKASREQSVLNLKIDLVKHVVETKMKEADARKNRAEAKLKKEKIASIIEKKQDESLESMSIEDLKKSMDELEV